MTKVSLLAVALSAGTVSSALAQTTTSDEQQANKAEITRDAATRTSLLTNDYGVNRNGGLTVWRQGDSSVTLSGQFQFRYTANFRNGGDGEETYTGGFGVRRAKLVAEADLNETWSVKLQGAFDRNGGSFELEDAWVDWELDDNWTIRAGQFKSPTLREELISSKRQQAVDRSVANETFNLGRTQGIMAIYGTDQWRFYASINDGARSENEDFVDPDEADIALAGRAEYLFAGDWSQLRDFAGWQGQEMAGMAGAAIAWETRGDTGGGNPTGTTMPEGWNLQATLDVQVEGNGWNAFGAFIYDYISPRGGDEVNNFAAVFQGGFFLDENNEIFGRYDFVAPDGDAFGDEDDWFNTITIGWNHYFIPESHASKFQLDFQYFINATTDTGIINGQDLSGIGLLRSQDDGQIAFRAQYQATF